MSVAADQFYMIGIQFADVGNAEEKADFNSFLSTTCTPGQIGDGSDSTWGNAPMIQMERPTHSTITSAMPMMVRCDMILQAGRIHSAISSLVHRLVSVRHSGSRVLPQERYVLSLNLTATVRLTAIRDALRRVWVLQLSQRTDLLGQIFTHGLRLRLRWPIRWWNLLWRGSRRTQHQLPLPKLPKKCYYRNRFSRGRKRERR